MIGHKLSSKYQIIIGFGETHGNAAVLFVRTIFSEMGFAVEALKVGAGTNRSVVLRRRVRVAVLTIFRRSANHCFR